MWQLYYRYSVQITRPKRKLLGNPTLDISHCLNLSGFFCDILLYAQQLSPLNFNFRYYIVRSQTRENSRLNYFLLICRNVSMFLRASIAVTTSFISLMAPSLRFTCANESTQMFRTQFEGDRIFFTQDAWCPVSLLYFCHFPLVFNLKNHDSLSVSLIIML